MSERIYFASHAGRIKIGTTGRGVTSRINEIAAHFTEPVILLGSIPGSFDLEHAIHAYLNDHRIKGEWFTDCGLVRRALDDLKTIGAAAMGIIPKPAISESRLRRFEQERQLTPNEKRVAVCRLMWPDDALVQLMALSGAEEATVRQWLATTLRPPMLVRYALGAALSRFILEETAPDFVAEAKADRAAHGPPRETISDPPYPRSGLTP